MLTDTVAQKPIANYVVRYARILHCCVGPRMYVGIISTTGTTVYIYDDRDEVWASTETFVGIPEVHPVLVRLLLYPLSSLLLFSPLLSSPLLSDEEGRAKREEQL